MQQFSGRKLLLVGLLFTILNDQAAASTLSVSRICQDCVFAGAISTGPTFASAGQTQTFYLSPNVVKTYAAQNTDTVLGQGAVFLGVQKSFPFAFLQVGVEAVTTSDANLQGQIWDDANSAFNNYTYQYQVYHAGLGVKGKLISVRGFYGLLPWVSVSLGAGFNYANSFSNMPTISQAIANNNFTPNMETAFTYIVGAGLQKALTQNWQAGLGYEFSDWGKSQLGRAAGQTMSTGPVLNHLYTNSIQFNITYVA